MPYGLSIPRDNRVYAEGLDRLRVPFADAIGEVGRDAWVHNPIKEISDYGEFSRAQYPQLRGPGQRNVPAEADVFMDPAELNEKYKDIGLTFSEPTRSGAVDILVRRKMEELRRNNIISRGPSGIGFGLASLATQLAVSAIDPLNIASAFIPVVGEARAAIWAERYGRLASRALTGAVEGAAGAAIVEPIVYGASQGLGDDYGALDSLLNVAVGGLLGGGLHAGFGAISDRLNRASPETREAALRGSVANLAEGKPVDVEPVLRADHNYRASGAPLARDVAEGYASPDRFLERVRADLELAAKSSRPPSSTSLLAEIVKAGGISTKNELGELTREGGEIAAIFKGYRRPGLINKSGRTPDAMREYLREHGWFGVREDAGGDLQDLYDAIGREVGGESVYHPDAHADDAAPFRAAMDREANEAGVQRGDSPRETERKIADYRLRLRAAEIGIRDADLLEYDDLRIAVEEREAVMDEPETAPPPPQADAGDPAPSYGRTDPWEDRWSMGDDIDAELEDATQRLADYVKQGVVAAPEADDTVALARQHADAAKAASICLLLHP